MATHYKIVFNGKIAPHATLEQAQQNLAKLFKTSVDKIASLFSGRLVVIKDKLDKDTAVKYHAALFRSGAECEIQEVVSQSPAGAESAQSDRRPAQRPGIANNAVPQQDQAAAACAPLPTPESSPQAPDEDGQSMIAPPGAVLVEPVKVEPLAVDTSRLSLAEAGAVLVEAEPVPEPEIDTSSLSIVNSDKQ